MNQPSMHNMYTVFDIFSCICNNLRAYFIYIFEVATTMRKITNINNEHNPYFRHLLHVYDPGLPLATACKHIGNRVTDNKHNAPGFTRAQRTM